MKITKTAAAWWLGAFIDGEGCIHYRDRGNKQKRMANGKLRGRYTRVLLISNTDYHLIRFAVKCFVILGIRCILSDKPGQTPNRKHVWTINIQRGAELARVQKKIPIQSRHKKENLRLAVKSFRGLHCFGCNCLHDEQTIGCYQCKKRHQHRKYYSDSKNRELE